MNKKLPTLKDITCKKDVECGVCGFHYWNDEDNIERSRVKRVFRERLEYWEEKDRYLRNSGGYDADYHNFLKGRIAELRELLGEEE